MKKVILYIGLIGILILPAGCYYDEVFEGDGSLPTNVSFSSDVIPIFDTNCNISGCHDAGPAHAPSLTRENAYTSLIQGNYISTTIPTQSKIYEEMAEGNMPPSGALAGKEVSIILGWITEGAKNN